MCPTGREGLRPDRRTKWPQTVETVRTWDSKTNAILALRAHLINEQVSLMVIGGDLGLLEATTCLKTPALR
jgi:hypothetical protein